MLLNKTTVKKNTTRNSCPKSQDELMSNTRTLYCLRKRLRRQKLINGEEEGMGEGFHPLCLHDCPLLFAR